MLATIQLVDVAAEARRLWGDESAVVILGSTVLEPDYRLQVADKEGQTTFHRGATADDVVRDLVRRGVLKEKKS